MNALVCSLALLSVHDEKYLAWVAEPVAATAFPVSSGQRLSPAELRELEAGKPVTPFVDLTTGIRAPDGSLWVGSQHGLMLLAPAQRGGTSLFAPLVAGRRCAGTEPGEAE